MRLYELARDRKQTEIDATRRNLFCTLRPRTRLGVFLWLSFFETLRKTAVPDGVYFLSIATVAAGRSPLVGLLISAVGSKLSRPDVRAKEPACFSEIKS